MRERDREKLNQLKRQAERAEAPAALHSRDPVEQVLEELRNDPALGRVSLTANFLNDVGYVLERDGFGAVETFLLDKASRRELATQAQFVLDSVLPRLRACPPVVARRALGRYIIKVLPALKRKEKKQ